MKLSEKAKELLKKMVSEYRASKTTEFDNLFYCEYPDTVIDELEDLGLIERKDNILESIILKIPD